MVEQNAINLRSSFLHETIDTTESMHHLPDVDDVCNVGYNSWYFCPPLQSYRMQFQLILKIETDNEDQTYKCSQIWYSKTRYQTEGERSDDGNVLDNCSKGHPHNVSSSMRHGNSLFFPLPKEGRKMRGKIWRTPMYLVESDREIPETNSLQQASNKYPRRRRRLKSY